MTALNQLLAAMATRETHKLPFASGIRYTENGQTLEVGDGLWGTLTHFAGEADATRSSGAARAGGYRVDFDAPDRFEATFFGAILETSTPGMLSLRVRTEAGQVTEIEAICVRLETPGERGGTVTLFQPSLLTRFEAAHFANPDPAMLAAAKPTPGTGTLRSPLPAIVDRYLDALRSGSSRGVEFCPDCGRRDNGVLTTGNPEAGPLDPANPGYRPFALGCAEQIDSGFYKRIARVRGRRHIAVDDIRGLVLSVALLDQPGDLDAIEVPGGGRVQLPRGILPEDLAATEGAAQFYVKRYEPNFRVPMTELTVQLTKIEGGRIARMECLSRGAPFGLVSGWPE